nr:MAG TPA: hypothetical protein [Caudoviricetes sp.]
MQDCFVCATAKNNTLIKITNIKQYNWEVFRLRLSNSFFVSSTLIHLPSIRCFDYLPEQMSLLASQALHKF